MGQPLVHIVGDDIVVRQAAAALLALGYGVACWNSGAQFLAAPTPEPDEYVLLDLDLDVDAVSGSDVLARLRAWEVMAPVIALVGFGDSRSESELIAAGAVWVLRKPIAADELGRALTIAQAAGLRRQRAFGSECGSAASRL